MNTEWTHKDEWRRRGENFLVTISRHYALHTRDGGPHRWAVYAYIYPNHSLFGEFSGGDMWQPAALELPLHFGPSLLKWHFYENGKPSSVQIGADYDHLHDERFTYYADPESAQEVFNDADLLFEYLTTRSTSQSQPNPDQP